MNAEQMREIVDAHFGLFLANLETGACLDVTPDTLITVQVEKHNILERSDTERWIVLNTEIEAEIAYFMESEHDTTSLVYTLAELSCLGCHTVDLASSIQYTGGNPLLCRIS